MPSQYGGVPSTVAYPAAINIAASSNASPIIVTCSTPHGLSTGDVVSISGHQSNVSANGQFSITVTSTTQFAIVAVGVAIGGATGTVQPLKSQSFQIPSDGDAASAAAFNVPYEALGDRSAAQLVLTGAYKLAATVSHIANTGTVGTSTGTCAAGGLTWVQA